MQEKNEMHIIKKYVQIYIGQCEMRKNYLTF